MITKIFLNNKLIYFTLFFFILLEDLFWFVNSRLQSRRVDYCFMLTSFHYFLFLSYKKHEGYLIGKVSI